MSPRDLSLPRTILRTTPFDSLQHSQTSCSPVLGFSVEILRLQFQWNPGKTLPALQPLRIGHFTRLWTLDQKFTGLAWGAN